MFVFFGGAGQVRIVDGRNDGGAHVLQAF
jgi:hypothetical protein